MRPICIYGEKGVGWQLCRRVAWKEVMTQEEFFHSCMRTFRCLRCRRRNWCVCAMKISQISRVTQFSVFFNETNNKFRNSVFIFWELMSARRFFVLFHLTKWKYFSRACAAGSEMVVDDKNSRIVCREEKCQRQLFLISRDGPDSWQSNFLLPSMLVTIMWLVLLLAAIVDCAREWILIWKFYSWTRKNEWCSGNLNRAEGSKSIAS